MANVKVVKASRNLTESEGIKTGDEITKTKLNELKKDHKFKITETKEGVKVKDLLVE